MARVTVEQVLGALAILFGGGTVGAIIRSRMESRKVNAEAASVDAKTPVEVESLTVTTLQQTTTDLRDENARLVARLKTVDAENDEYRRQIDALRDEIQHLREALTSVERRFEALQRAHPDPA